MTKSRKNEALIRNDGVYVISGIFCRANACVCGKNAFPPRPLAANRQICKRSGRFVGKPEVCQRSGLPLGPKGAVGVSRLRDCLIMLSAKPTEGLPHYAAGASRLRSCLSCAPAFRMKASFSRYFVKSWGCRKTGAAAPFSKPAGDKHKALRGSRPKTPREA